MATVVLDSPGSWIKDKSRYYITINEDIMTERICRFVVDEIISRLLFILIAPFAFAFVTIFYFIDVLFITTFYFHNKDLFNFMIAESNLQYKENLDVFVRCLSGDFK